jgi:hypothetical protein
VQNFFDLDSRESDDLVNRAVQLCSRHNKPLAIRLRRILKFPDQEPANAMDLPSPPVFTDPLATILTIFSYVGTECNLQGSVCREQVDACVQEVAAELARQLAQKMGQDRFKDVGLGALANVFTDEPRRR